jgi:hypothetical protein
MRKTLLFAVLMVAVLVSVSFAETKTYTVTVRQLFGGGQSPDSAAVSAVARAKREALEQAGTYVESMTVVRDSAVAADEILALSAGLLKTDIIARKNIMEGDLFGIEVTARVNVDTAIMEVRVKALLADRGSLEEIKKLKVRERDLLDRVRELEIKNLALLKSPDKSAEKDLSRAFGETSSELEDVGRLLDAKFAAIARDISEIKQATVRIEKSQEKMALSLEKISSGFEELARQGGIISSPKTPEEFYSNARSYELRGDYGNARRAYMEYFRFDLDYVDPHVRFQTFLKVQEGREGAREVYEYIRKQGKSFVVPFVSLLLLDREARVRGLEEFARKRPDFGPVYYELSRDYSEARLPVRGIEDKRREKEYLEKFMAAYKDGRFVRWFIDKAMVAEYLADSEKRFAELGATPATLMEKPVSVSWMKSNAGWTATMIIAEPAIEVSYRLDSDRSFKSTGFTQITHPQTGKPMPVMFTSFPFTGKPLKLWVKYKDRQGREMGPWVFTLDPGGEAGRGDKDILEMTKTSWISLREFDGKTLVYFTHLMSWRGGISRIYYGVDKETPDKEFKFPPHKGAGTALITEDVPVYVEVPSGVKFVTVRVVYFDRTQSDVVTFAKSE